MGIVTPAAQKKIDAEKERTAVKATVFLPGIRQHAAQHRIDAEKERTAVKATVFLPGMRQHAVNVEQRITPRKIEKSGTNSRMYTIVLHHPARPVNCLIRTLEALRGATAGDDHVVDVIVQGTKDDTYGYPKEVDGYHLRYCEVGSNIGIGGGFKLGVERFLQTDAKWLAKIDDDIAVSRRGWDILAGIIEYERTENGRKLGASMMSTGRTRTRLLCESKSPNGLNIIDVVDGDRGCGQSEMFGRQVTWKLTDFSDVGCTIFPRELFESGCLPDEELHVGGIGLDLVYQGNQRGFNWSVCCSPLCDHFGADCHNMQYTSVRNNKDTYIRSHLHFYKKWGVVPMPLARAAGMVRKYGKVHV